MILLFFLMCVKILLYFYRFADIQLCYGVPYLFEYNAQNFVRNFNQKSRARLIHEFFHQHGLFLSLFFSFIIFLQPLLILFAAMRNLCFLTKDLMGTSSHHSTLDSKHKRYAKIQPLKRLMDGHKGL